MNKIDQYQTVTKHSEARNGYIILWIYRPTFHIRRTMLGNEIVNHSDVVGASPVGVP